MTGTISADVKIRHTSNRTRHCGRRTHRSGNRRTPRRRRGCGRADCSPLTAPSIQIQIQIQIQRSSRLSRLDVCEGTLSVSVSVSAALLGSSSCSRRPWCCVHAQLLACRCDSWPGACPWPSDLFLLRAAPRQPVCGQRTYICMFAFISQRKEAPWPGRRDKRLPFFSRLYPSLPERERAPVGAPPARSHLGQM